MKTRLLLLSAALALTALAPAAQAEASVSTANPCDRPGSDLGVHAAVGDACLGTRATWCTLWIEWTAIPAPDTCLVAPPQPPIASSGPLDPQCMEVYSRTDVGAYSVVRTDSCAPPQVYECPYEGAPTSQCRDLLALEASASGSMAPCYYIYTRTDVGTYSVVRRSSCAPPEVYECPYEGAPIEQCRYVWDGTLATSASSQEPMCMYYYYEYEVGPVRYVQRDSCHSETYVCGVPVRQYLAGQPDPVGLATCTVDSLGVLA